MDEPVYQIKPIGHVRCRPRYRYEAPRQGVLGDAEAVIELNDAPDLLTGLQGLEGFDRIWVIFVLHLNETWRPMVQPPHEGVEKKGVFATRSPHRPNRIGMSCVKLVKIDGRNVHISAHDLLDRTPIVDIKPYLPYADAFPDAAGGWLDDISEPVFAIELSAQAQEKADWILAKGELDVVNFLHVQLQNCPTDGERKRIEKTAEGDWVIAYRTWRIQYTVDGENQVITVVDIWSGYSDEDLSTDRDPHKDKDVHREFRQAWSR